MAALGDSNNYYNLAISFQNAKIDSGKTTLGQAFTAVRGMLKNAFFVLKAQGKVDVGSVDAITALAKRLFKAPQAQEKAMKKFIEWNKKSIKPKNEIAQEKPAASLNDVAAEFETVFMKTVLSDDSEALLVRAAREAKKAFKKETKTRLEDNACTAQSLQAELQAEASAKGVVFSPQTLHKVVYWVDKFKLEAQQ